MSRLDQAPAPVSAAVTEYITREQALFGQEYSASDRERLQISVTESPRMRVMEEFFRGFLSPAFQGYKKLIGGNYTEKNFLGETSLDRFANDYGVPAVLAGKLFNAESSRVEHEAFNRALLSLGVTWEGADEGQKAEVASAVEVALEAQKQFLVGIGIAERAAQVRVESLSRDEIDEYAALGAKVRAKALFMKHCPLLAGEVLAAEKPVSDDLWNSGSQVMERLRSSLTKDSFPKEMVSQAEGYGKTLLLDSTSGVTQQQLIQSTSRFVAQVLSISTLYIQSIMASELSRQLLPDFVGRFSAEMETIEHLEAKRAYVIVSIIRSFITNGLSQLAITSLSDSIATTDGRPILFNNDLVTYFSPIMTHLPAIIAKDITVPASYDEARNPYARLNYGMYLLLNIDKPDLSAEDNANIAKLKPYLKIGPGVTTLSADIITSLATYVQPPERAYSLIYKKLNELSKIFDARSYSALSRDLVQNDYSENPVAAIQKFGLDLAGAVQQPCYAKTMAALYLCYETGSPHNEAVLEAVSPARRLEVYGAIVEMAFACRGESDGEISDPQGVVNHLTNLVFKLNNGRLTESLADESESEKKVRQAHAINLIRLRLNEYLAPKEVLHGGSVQPRFLALKPKQQAERNIAAAYQILALLEQLETYNVTEPIPENKELAYNAVMNVVTDLVKQAEIRGYRVAEGQSSQFVKLLNFDIPHALVAARDGKKTIVFPQGFDRTEFDAIGEIHRRENKWYKRFFKRSNNWIRQNSFTTAAFVLSGVLITLAAAALTLALLSPALPIVLPLLSIAITASNLVIPAAIAALAGLSVSLVSIIFNNQNTANAKMGYAGLGKLKLTEAAPASASASASASVSVPVQLPLPAVQVSGVAVDSSEGARTPTSLGSGASDRSFALPAQPATVLRSPAGVRPRALSEGSPAGGGFRSSRHNTPPTLPQGGSAAEGALVAPDPVATTTVPTVPVIGRGRGSSH